MKQRNQRGETMIEVLVTSIILALGILGVASMQVASFKNLSSSNNTSIAAIMGYSLSERIRANPTGNYIHTTAPASFTNCATTSCDATTLAAYDIASWTAELTSTLPAASAQVVAGTLANSFNITLRWDDDRSGSSGTGCFDTGSSDDLDCYRLTVTL